MNPVDEDQKRQLIERLQQHEPYGPQLAICATCALDWCSTDDRYGHQVQAICRLLEHLLDGRTTAADCILPTGTGKTRILAAIALIASKFFRSPVPIITPSSDISEQNFLDTMVLARKFTKSCERAMDEGQIAKTPDGALQFRVHWVVTKAQMDRMSSEERDLSNRSNVSPNNLSKIERARLSHLELILDDRYRRVAVLRSTAFKFKAEDAENTRVPDVLIYNFHKLIERKEKELEEQEGKDDHEGDPTEEEAAEEGASVGGDNSAEGASAPDGMEESSEEEDNSVDYNFEDEMDPNAVEYFNNGDRDNTEPESFRDLIPRGIKFDAIVVDDTAGLGSLSLESAAQENLGIPLVVNISDHRSTVISPFEARWMRNEEVRDADAQVLEQLTFNEYKERLAKLDWFMEMRLFCTNDHRVLAVLALIEALSKDSTLFNRLVFIDTEFLRSEAGYIHRPLEPCSRLVQLGACFLEAGSNEPKTFLRNVSEPLELYHSCGNIRSEPRTDQFTEPRTEQFRLRYLSPTAYMYNKKTLKIASGPSGVRVASAWDAIDALLQNCKGKILFAYGSGLPDEYIIHDILSAKCSSTHHSDVAILNLAPFFYALLRTLEKPKLSDEFDQKSGAEGSRKLEFLYRLLVLQGQKQEHTADKDAVWLMQIFQNLVKGCEASQNFARGNITPVFQFLNQFVSLAEVINSDKKAMRQELPSKHQHMCLMMDRKEGVLKMELAGLRKVATIERKKES